MTEKKTLAIMAAGLGSRFGSLKQAQAVSPQGYSIMDHSVYDAARAGFNRIVIVIRESILDHFDSRYNNKLPKHVSVEYVTQETHIIPKPYKTNRVKPWGTAHALWILKPFIKEKFAIINADDLYGLEAFVLMHDALYKNKSDDNYFIGYHLGKTMSVNGPVSRGECVLDEQGYLNNIKERKSITKLENGLIVYQDPNNNQVKIDPKTIVSMNFWGFSPDVFRVAELLFKKFLSDHDDSETSEFQIPNLVDHMIKNELKEFKMLSTNSQWFGITYEKDLPVIKRKVRALTKKGVYPESLW